MVGLGPMVGLESVPPCCRGVFQPLVLSWVGGTAKCHYLDMTDRLEPPPLPEGHGVSLAYSCLLDVVRSVSLVVDIQGQEEEEEHGEPWADIHLFVSMPLKYGMGIEEPNKVIGMAHGLLFMLYVLAVIQNKITRDWSYKTMFIALAVSIIPFGTFWADKKLFKDME